jgi:hypothetical protein
MHARMHARKHARTNRLFLLVALLLLPQHGTQIRIELDILRGRLLQRPFQLLVHAVQLQNLLLLFLLLRLQQLLRASILQPTNLLRSSSSTTASNVDRITSLFVAEAVSPSSIFPSSIAIPWTSGGVCCGTKVVARLADKVGYEL